MRLSHRLLVVLLILIAVGAGLAFGPAGLLPRRVVASDSREARDRKAASIAACRAQGLAVDPLVPPIEDSATAHARSVDEMAKRAIGICIAASSALRMDPKAVAEQVHRYRADLFMTPEETAFVKTASPSEADRARFSWRIEQVYVMLWALGYVDPLRAPEAGCSSEEVIKTVASRSLDELVQGAHPRSLTSLLDEADLTMRYDRAIDDARSHGALPPKGLNPDVVAERHYALSWLIGHHHEDYDHVTF